MKVIVCQDSARHRYAIPRMLEEAGLLGAVYTDSCTYSLSGKMARILSPYLSQLSVKRLANREIRGVPKHKIHTTDAILISDIIHRIFGHENSLQKSRRQHNILSEHMIRWGVCNGDVIYSMYHANHAFLQYAKTHGKKIVIDVYSNPIFRRLIDDEATRFPQWGHHVSGNLCLEYEDYFKKTVVFSDYLLCPSNWAAEGVQQLCPEQTHKIKVVPYGSSISYGGRINAPVRGRIFWAGNSAIGKGLHYVAMAANALIPKYPDLEFRIAGISDTKVVHLPECKNLNFLGILNKQQMQNEFLSADMFIFPTISEGLASVLLEAINAGCPIITNRCSGINTIENGHNGVIISEQNPESLIDAIQKMYLDRNFRNNISINSLEMAAFYTEKAWSERLVSLIRSI